MIRGRDDSPKFPWANSVLLFFLIAQMASGYLGFTQGKESASWALQVHGIVGYGILIVLFWKGANVLEGLDNHREVTLKRLGTFLLSLLLLAVLLTGWVWGFSGPAYLGGFSLMTIHVMLAVGLLTLLIWHTWNARFILQEPESRGRRSFLQTGVIGVAGLLAWLFVGAGKAALGFPGANRRFTGSYEIGSYTGQFPAASWIADRPQPVEVGVWRLMVEGEVDRPLSLDYAQLRGLHSTEVHATLDCTGGWYSTQVWRGVPVGYLLDLAGIRGEARSVTFESVTGYKRRFPLPEARNFTLATGVAGKRLTHDHGYPVRLVAPEKRGYAWVKWVVGVRVNSTSAVWQSPLPLQ